MCWSTNTMSRQCYGGGMSASTSFVSGGATTSITSCYNAACGPRTVNATLSYCVSQHATTNFYIIVSFQLTIWIWWGCAQVICTYVIVSTSNLQEWHNSKLYWEKLLQYTPNFWMVASSEIGWKWLSALISIYLLVLSKFFYLLLLFHHYIYTMYDAWIHENQL